MSFISIFSSFLIGLRISSLWQSNRPQGSSSGLPVATSLWIGLVGLVVALGTVACTPNLGGDNVGWAPISVTFSETPGEPTRVYVASELSNNLDDLATQTGLDLGEDERQVKVMALDDFGSGTPRVVWTYPPLGNGAGLLGMFGPPAVSKELGLVYVGAVDGYVHAISIETGDDRQGWKRAARTDPALDPQPIIGAPVLTQIIRSDTGPSTILVAVSEDGNLYAFSAADGEELPWSPFRTGGKIWSTPAIQNSIAYFGSQDHSVYAVDLRDGSELWRYQTGGAIVGNPLLFSGNVFIGSFDRKLYALDADDGELEWEFESGNWFWAGPVTDGETVFAPSMDGYVYAFDPGNPSTGEPKEHLWRHNMESPVVSSPRIVPIGLVVAAVDGRMRLLSTSPSDLENGEVISNLPSLEDGEIKAPLVAGAPAIADTGAEATGLSIIQRYSIFAGGDNGIVRRISVTEGQDKEAIWCFDSSIQRQCN